MTLQNIKNLKQKEGGFTIVELLIVIVIIAILATLIIVAYTGIQNRARLTKNQDDAANISKKAEAYAADTNGTYPSGGTSAALTTSYNSDKVSTLPAGVTLSYASAVIATNGATTGKTTAGTYDVFICTGGGGNRVYYYDPTAADSVAAKYSDAGTCP